jgi:uncharacterized protein YbaR (Trm112 family)
MAYRIPTYPIMFIELAEHLLCPEPHTPESYCVLAPDEMAGRDVRRGSIGCPICGREYSIVGGVADLGGDPWSEREFAEAGPPAQADPETVHAFLGITTPGGYVVLVGSAAVLANEFLSLIEGVHPVAVNAPPGLDLDTQVSVLSSLRCIPLRSAMARGVVVGAEHCREPWLSDCARILSRGLRLVALSEAVVPPDVERMVAGQGMWVGEKR